MNKNQFMKKYPPVLQDLLISPSVFRETFLKDLPFPQINHIRDICEYANFSYGAVRTSLSRKIKAKLLDCFTDKNRIKRYRLTRTQQHVSEVLSADFGDAEDFSIVIFSFNTKQEKQRRDVRFLLQGYGFRLFAQNTYIRRKIKKEPFEKSLKEYGLENNVFLFDCSDPGTLEFKKRLFSQFEMDKMQRITNTFYSDLNNFLTEDLDAEEYSRRMLYIGPIYYHISYENEVPVPKTYYPENYPIQKLKMFFQTIPEQRWKDFITYYMNIENKGDNL